MYQGIFQDNEKNFNRQTSGLNLIFNLKILKFIDIVRGTNKLNQDIGRLNPLYTDKLFHLV